MKDSSLAKAGDWLKEKVTNLGNYVGDKIEEGFGALKDFFVDKVLGPLVDAAKAVGKAVVWVGKKTAKFVKKFG